jgi:hypothetical protein
MYEYLQALKDNGLTREMMKRIFRRLSTIDFTRWDQEGAVAALAGQFYNEEMSNHKQVQIFADSLNGLFSFYRRPDLMKKDCKIIVGFFAE